MRLASTADGCTVHLEQNEAEEFSPFVRSSDDGLELCIYRNTRPTGYVSVLGVITDVAWLSIEAQKLNGGISIAVPLEIAEQIRAGTETKIAVRAAKQGNLQHSAVFAWPEAGETAFPKRDVKPIRRQRGSPGWIVITVGSVAAVAVALAVVGATVGLYLWLTAGVVVPNLKGELLRRRNRSLPGLA
jgi:hypothetical protein